MTTKAIIPDEIIQPTKLALNLIIPDDVINRSDGHTDDVIQHLWETSDDLRKSVTFKVVAQPAPGKRYWLANHRHQFLALKEHDPDCTVSVEVIPGITQADATAQFLKEDWSVAPTIWISSKEKRKACDILLIAGWSAGKIKKWQPATSVSTLNRWLEQLRATGRMPSPKAANSPPSGPTPETGDKPALELVEPPRKPGRPVMTPIEKEEAEEERAAAKALVKEAEYLKNRVLVWCQELDHDGQPTGRGYHLWLDKHPDGSQGQVIGAQTPEPSRPLPEGALYEDNFDEIIKSLVIVNKPEPVGVSNVGQAEHEHTEIGLN